MFHNTLIHSQYTVGMKSFWNFERVIKKSQSTTKTADVLFSPASRQLLRSHQWRHRTSVQVRKMIWKRYRCGGVIVDQLITTQLGRRAGWDIGVRAGCVWRQSPRKAVMSHSALSSTFNPVMFIFTSDVRSCSARSPASHKLVTVELFFCLILMTFHYIKYGW